MLLEINKEHTIPSFRSTGAYSQVSDIRQNILHKFTYSVLHIAQYGAAMLVCLHCIPTSQLVNSVNIWNLLINQTEQANN